jgi:pimeloyl-ACP methyl ester carboxylesterase
MATFLLVHGTFAKSAHWPALQDGLAAAAQEAGKSASFRQLVWSGKNRAAARQAAASAIVKSVQDIQSNLNNEDIFLIGHSHGGSAIAYFLKEYTEVAKTLSGCAFLSTPFIAIRPRNKELFWSVFFLPFIAAVFFWNKIIDVGFVWAIGNMLAICFCILTSKVYGAHKFLEHTIRQQTADIPPGNYFFIRCTGDEAAGFLSAAQFINWLNMNASKILVLVTSSRILLSAILVPFLLFISLLLLMPNALGVGIVDYIKGLIQFLAGEFTKSPGAIIAAVLFGFVLIASLLFMLCVVLGFFIFLVQAFTSMVFGWTSLATGFLVELAIEPLPFGTYSLAHVDWNAETTGSEGLTHSWTYAHPAAIRHLQNWVKASLAAHRLSSSENLQPKELQPANAS